MKLLDVTVISTWNGDFEVRSKAKLNPHTLEVTDIATADETEDHQGNDLEELTSQQIVWGRSTIDLHDHSDGVFYADPDPEIHQKIKDIARDHLPFGGNPVAYIPLPEGYEGVRPMKVLASLSQLVELDERPIQKYEKGTTFYYELKNAVVFVYGEIQPIDAKEKQELPQITRMLTLSTFHLDKTSLRLLDDEERSGLVVYKKSDFGWFIYLDYATIEEDIEHIPDNLKAVLRYAQQQQVGLLCLDHDAPKTPALPIYED